MTGAEDEAGVDRLTREADDEEGRAAHGADRPPTSEESEAAERSLAAEDEEEREAVAERFREMAERGAHEKGEGRI
jgi:hypothetical protein